MEKSQGKFPLQVEKLLQKLCEQNPQVPIIYQLADFKSNELGHLKGGEALENKDVNPSLGLRGVERALTQKIILNFELRILKELRNKLVSKTFGLVFLSCAPKRN
jgi:phosphoenolpyruvate synthase/pyruvate phosphate dikinase